MKTESVQVLNYRSLCRFDSEHLLVSKRNELFTYQFNTRKIRFLTSIPTGFKQKVFGRSRLLSRLFRLGVHTAVAFRGDIYFAFNRSIYAYDPKTNRVRLEMALIRGSRPLNLTAIQQIPGFEDGLYFGEYFSNSSNDSVHLFRKDMSEWKSVFSFPKGTIEHVHNLIPDPFQNCVWILTGDFGDGAAIWKATDGFRKVEPALKGSQQFRACVAFPTENGLLYATDSQIEKNHLCLLTKENDLFQSRVLTPINGPSIYGCRLKDFFIFSTSTEPAQTEKPLILKLIDRQKGTGILKDQAEILVINRSFQIELRINNPKDILPYIPFQFGSIVFPSGMEQTNFLCSFNIALKRNDFKTEIRTLTP